MQIVTLSVPEGRARCAHWIATQSPDVVADCLTVTEAVYGALQRELSDLESSKLQCALQTLRGELEIAQVDKDEALKDLRNSLTRLQGEQLANKQREYDLLRGEILRQGETHTRLRREQDDRFAQERAELLRTHEALLSRVREENSTMRDNLLSRIDSFSEELRACKSNELATYEALKKQYSEQLQHSRDTFDAQLLVHAQFKDEQRTTFLQDREELFRDHQVSLSRVRDEQALYAQELQAKIGQLTEELSQRNVRASTERDELREAFTKEKERIASDHQASLLRARDEQSAHAQELRTQIDRLAEELGQRNTRAVAEHSEQRDTFLKEREQLIHHHQASVLRAREELAGHSQELQTKIHRLTEEIGQRDSRLAADRTDQQLHFQQQLEVVRRHSEQKLADERKALQEQQSQAERDKQYLREEIAQQRAYLTRVQGEKDTLLERTAKEKSEAERRHGEALTKLYTEKEDLVAEQRSFLSSLRGNTGKMGEAFVQQIVANMQLGEWTTTSGVQSDGHADALWSFECAGAMKLRALVEIKWTASLHSQKDIAKFWTNVTDAVRQDRVNAAVFISLSARIPNTRPLQITMSAGIPVLQISRAADAVIPPAAMIEMGLLALAQAWPLVSRNGGEHIDGVVESVAQHFESQLAEIDKFSRTIENLDRTGIQLQRNAAALRKVRDSMTSSIEQTRLRYPQLCLEALEAAAVSDGDPWESEAGVGLLDTVASYKAAKGRYPKGLRDLEPTEAALAFAENVPNCVDVAVRRLKAQVVRKRPRTTAEDDEKTD